MRALCASNLFFSYEKDRPVLQDLSLEVREGEILAILGPNGSGKTTFLHLLLRELRPERGDIYFFERPASSYSRKELSLILALARQEERVAFQFTVLEYVLMGRAPYLRPLEAPGKKDLEVAFEALKATGMESLYNRYLTALSGGERQLVIIARTIAQNPRIFLLDEPLAHLDLKNQKRLLDILLDLKKRGKTIVFTTHDPNSAALVADRVLIISNGKSLAFGEVRQVFQREVLSAVYGVKLEVDSKSGRPLIYLENGTSRV